MKTRKQLPAFGYLKDWHIDIGQLILHLRNHNLLDMNTYNCCKFSTAGNNAKQLLAVNHIIYNQYFKQEAEKELESNKFVQIQLTEFNGNCSNSQIEYHPSSYIERARRVNPDHPKYVPVADELNYGQRGPLVIGEIEKIFDMFTSKITRARLNYLEAGHEIKPHIDHDPSYVTRYHIPVLTNPGVEMHIEKQGQLHTQHLPADGRVYFFNAGFKHWVKNESNAARLHLIIDVHGQHELDQLVEI